MASLAPQSPLFFGTGRSGKPSSGSRKPLGGRLAGLDKQVTFLNKEQAPLELTFGVEIEFLLLGDVPEFRVNGTIDSNLDARLLVYQALTEPTVAECAQCLQPHTFLLPVATPHKYTSWDERRWSIVTDSSVHVSHSSSRPLRDSVFWGMELVSRPFVANSTLPTGNSITDLNHKHCITVDQEITLMLEKLNYAFNTPAGLRNRQRANNRIAINSTCGFHVHVGNGIQSQGFPLQTIKNILALYVAHERPLDSIHSVDRISGSKYAIMPLSEEYKENFGFIPGVQPYNLSNATIFVRRAFKRLSQKSNGEGSVISEWMYPDREFQQPDIKQSACSFEPGDWLNLIQKASNGGDLRNLHIEFEHRNTLNLQNLAPFGESSRQRRSGKVTVEFRQHAGTLEAAEILAWIDVCTHLVQFAHASTPAQMRTHLDDALNDPNPELLQLLETLGCNASTQSHYKHVLGQGSPDPELPDYASARSEKQLKLAHALPATDTRELLCSLIDGRAKALDPEAVQAKITAKFKLGGYGRFSKPYLDGYHPSLSDDDKQRLTAGDIITQYPDADDILDEAWSEGGDSEDLQAEPCDKALSPTDNHIRAPNVPAAPQGEEQGFDAAGRSQVGRAALPMRPARPPATTTQSEPQFRMLPPPLLPVRPASLMERRNQSVPGLRVRSPPPSHGIDGEHEADQSPAEPREEGDE